MLQLKVESCKTITVRKWFLCVHSVAHLTGIIESWANSNRNQRLKNVYVNAGDGTLNTSMISNIFKMENALEVAYDYHSKLHTETKCFRQVPRSYLKY